VSFVKDIWKETDFFFKAPESYDPDVIRKRWKPETPAQLTELIDILAATDNFDPPATEAAVKAWIERKGYNTGSVLNAFRLVIVGESRGPHMFDIIAWIGKEESIKRIKKGIEAITSLKK
jgi:glutamyl-tRNA synthetase